MNNLKKFIGYILYVFIGSWMPHYQCGLQWGLCKNFKKFVVIYYLIKVVITLI